MNIKDIRELIQLIEESDIEEFEMERSGVRVRVRKTLSRGNKNTKPAIELATSPTAEAPAQLDQLQSKSEEELHLVSAPIVGTFYISTKPDTEPFVQVGDQVKKGTVLCIIEAMKLFNQIESDVNGKIMRLLVENGQPVEYGQPLFEIHLAG